MYNKIKSELVRVGSSAQSLAEIVFDLDDTLRRYNYLPKGGTKLVISEEVASGLMLGGMGLSLLVIVEDRLNEQLITLTRLKQPIYVKEISSKYKFLEVKNICIVLLPEMVNVEKSYGLFLDLFSDYGFINEFQKADTSEGIRQLIIDSL